MSIYCLFVGINHYKANYINNLGGCKNDVLALQEVLKERFNIPDKNIVSLLDDKATRSAILDRFENHLGQAQKGDTALFYYSGHGSQERANEVFWEIEDDHFNETLVCHDSRVDDHHDLADKELRFLINKIGKNKPRIVSIIDSCHSGGATRGFEDDDDEQIRQAPVSGETRPLDSYIFYNDAKAEGWLNDMSQLKEGNHIEMSACRNTQLSKEKYVARTKHGVFTYYLQQTLKYSHDLPSYRNLNAIVSQKVQGTVDMQHPQVDAIGDSNITELFLADNIEPAKSQLYYENNGWWINVGLSQGINKGARLLVTIENKTESTPERHSEAEIIEVLHNKSRVNISPEDTLATNRQYQTIMTDPVLEKLPIRLSGDNEQQAQLREALAKSKILEENNEYAEYEIQGLDASCYQLSRLSSLPVFAPIATASEVIQQAEKIAHWKQTLNLAYATGELPYDSVKIVVEQINPSNNSASKLNDKANEVLSNKEINLNYQWHNGEWQKPRVKINLQLNLEEPLDDNKIYVSLLFLDSLTGQIKLLVNNENLIRETKTVWDGNAKTHEYEKHSVIVKSQNKNQFQFSVDERLLKKGITKTSDYLKLVITNFENDMSGFEQLGFSKDKRTTACGGENTQNHTRGMDENFFTDTPKFIPKASTQTITLNTISPLKSVHINNEKAVKITDSIKVLAHEMNATISLEEAHENPDSITKGTDSSLLSQPEIFKNNPYSQPLSLTSHRGLDSKSTVIRIDFPETRSIDSAPVSEKNPLIIEVDQQLMENQQILPYAQDGEFYIPLGYAKRYTKQATDSRLEKTHIIIETLPESLSDMANADEGRRSIGGSIYIYLQKVFFDTLKIEHDTSRLASPEFTSVDELTVNHYEDSEEILKKKVAQANKILLFVHGIMGDTKTMAGSINANLPNGEKIQEYYDLILTFDYENLNTPIAETAEALIKKLAKLGLDDSHSKQLDIVAHSMGGLVSRWMIEKNPASPKVNKLIMLGTPNGGSPLRDVKQWAFTTMTLVLNGIALTSITGLTVSVLAKLLNSMDDTLDEMDKNSKTLQFLYEAKDPKVPYYMIAGDTKNLRIQLDNSTSKLSRFMTFIRKRSKLAVADIFTDKLFGEVNDIAVSQKSMLHIPDDRKHPMNITKIDCDHTSYFTEQTSLQELAKRLSEN